jgi:photosystem II stability/assembly factor-like uncharacterized protein
MSTVSDPRRLNKKRRIEYPDREAGVLGHTVSLLRGWPALLMTAAMIVATVFAFARPEVTSFPPTKTRPNKLLVNGLVHQGHHYILTGEDGHILIADGPRGPWRQAKVQPQRGSTLTRVQFIGKGIAIAVGHSGWILRSNDNGATWKEVAFNKHDSTPLLGIAGPFNGKVYAFGGYGLFMVSSDQGRHWQRRMLKQTSGAGNGEKTGNQSKTNPSSPDYDPFASFAAGGDEPPLSQRHIYGMVQVSNGSLFMVGEDGLIGHSTNGGKTWQVLDSIYAGSFYGILELPRGGLLVYGMGGHVFVSHDLGKHWQASHVPVKQSLFGGTVTADGKIALVGAADMLLVSTDGGKHFSRRNPRGPNNLTSVLALPGGGWLAAGTGGLAVLRPGKGES